MNLTKDQVSYMLYPLQNTGVTAEVATKLKIVAIAKAVAYALPMPSSPVTNLNSYFIDNCRDMSDALTSNVNEYEPFDVRLCNDLIYQIFRARYNVLHVPRKVDCHLLTDAMIRASGVADIEGQFKGFFEQANGDSSFEPANRASRMLFDAFTGE